jgi:hypothetical protein
MKPNITAGCDEFTSTAGVDESRRLAAHIRKSAIRLKAIITRERLQVSAATGQAGFITATLFDQCQPAR